ncbi:MAG: energy transducer TonB, partial [Halochromatium sp.]
IGPPPAADDSEPEPESEPERAQPNAAALLETEAIEDSPEPPSISAADIFASRQAELASLTTAKTKQQSRANASGTRRKTVSAAPRDRLFDSYRESLSNKVERIGNLNYPREARERGLYGRLTLHLAVRSDGTLKEVRVVRSSGHEVLDQAAVHIVELAAPFARFPAGLKRETDVLDIIVPWQFQRNHRLSRGR